VGDDVRIGDAMQRTVGVRQIGVGRTERVDERPAGRILGLPLGCADPSVAVAHAPIVDRERMDHAVAAKPVVVRARRHELRIGAVAQQRALKLGRQPSCDREGVGIRFGPDRGEIAGEKTVLGRRLHDVDLPSCPARLTRG
jgi:hypothetical protein